jgi:acylphosphatase
VEIELHQFHAIIRGRVQGVSFRSYTALKAAELAVNGWVRNLPDGTVELTAKGERGQLDQLAEFLHQGPAGAYVESVEIKWQEPTGEFEDFSIR